MTTFAYTLLLITLFAGVTACLPRRTAPNVVMFSILMLTPGIVLANMTWNIWFCNIFIMCMTYASLLLSRLPAAMQRAVILRSTMCMTVAATAICIYLLPRVPKLLRDERRQQTEIVAAYARSQASLAQFRADVEASVNTAQLNTQSLNAIMAEAVTARQK